MGDEILYQSKKNVWTQLHKYVQGEKKRYGHYRSIIYVSVFYPQLTKERKVGREGESWASKDKA